MIFGFFLAHARTEYSYRFNYTGKCEEKELKRGRYLFEVWGAQGGLCSNSNEKARGGYAYGVIKLDFDVTVNVCVGGQGQSYTKPATEGFPSGGFNGGGNGATGNRNGTCSGGGGGATDIRLTNNLTKLIVAGGGGGCIQYNYVVYSGGVGGGLIGGDGEQPSDHNGENLGRGGQQFFTDNAGNYTSGNINSTAESGQFGIGGAASAPVEASAGDGGGGYFGGGGGADVGSGGGGSGFLHSYMIGEVLSGDREFIDPNGVKETGHPANGYAKITKLNAVSCKMTQTISIPPIIFILSLIK